MLDEVRIRVGLSVIAFSERCTRVDELMHSMGVDVVFTRECHVINARFWIE